MQHCCWSCLSPAPKHTQWPPVYGAIASALQAAGLLMCPSCADSRAQAARAIDDLPGLRAESVRYLVAVYSTAAGHRWSQQAWVYRTEVLNGENAEMLYRLARPRVKVLRCYSVPGWLFVVIQRPAGQ